MAIKFEPLMSNAALISREIANVTEAGFELREKWDTTHPDCPFALAPPYRETYSSPPKRTRAPNGTFDRRAYQRELMQKRRLEGKA